MPALFPFNCDALYPHVYVRNIIQSYLEDKGIVLPFDLVSCTQEGRGDFACAIAFSLAKICKKSPLVIAEELADFLRKADHIESTVVVGGYVNITMDPALWCDLISHILRKDLTFGHNEKGQGRSVLIEYVSANPTGPLHAAHARGAILGDIMGNILKANGYHVVREYYINDAGQQMIKLARTVLIRCKAFHEKKEAVIPDGLYPGLYVQEIADQWLKLKGACWQDGSLEEIAAFSTRVMMQDIQSDLESLGVFMDILTSEKAIQEIGLIQRAVDVLKEKGFVYKGVLPRPLGQEQDDWCPSELLLFRSRLMGDDQDRPLQRSDGAWTYFAGDVGYHWNKVIRGYDILIDVWGADHASHVQRMKAAVHALTGKDLEIFLFQMVHFYKNGQLLKMSKRAGSFITIRDVLSMIDADALRFMMVTKKADTHFEFDVEKVKLETKDNPVFYVQYAHARCCSILRALSKLWGNGCWQNAPFDAQDFIGGTGFDLIKILAEWPKQLDDACQTREPHRITLYLYKISQEFHALWQEGNGRESMRFVQPQNKALSLKFGALIKAVSCVLASGLAILGVKAKDELR